MYNEKRDLLETLKRLGYSVVNIHEATNIPLQRMYKWYKGESLPKIEDYKILKNFLESTRNPTNDFHGKTPYNNEPTTITMAAEDEVPYGVNANALNRLILFQDKEIAELKFKLQQCLQEKTQVNDTRKTA